jgi:hypothetical protein
MLRLGRSEDNRRMNKESDLLPWILGGLSAMAAAAAVTAIATQHASPAIPRPIAIASAPAPAPLATSAAAAASAPAPLPAEEAPMPSATASASPQPEAQGGQIWACTTNGVKTFSNNPCGEKSALLEVSPINTMRPTPPIHYARVYPQPQFAPSYNEAPAQPYAEEDSDEAEGYENGGNSYTVIQGMAFVPRRRPTHPHRPPIHHSAAPAPRKL